MNPTAGISPLHGVARLDHLGVILVSGEDAAKFIHGQLSHDFALLGLDTARLAAYCNPKGRMLASFIGFKRTGGDIVLVCSRDILAPTLKRLSMFVMRAKARLTDATDQFALFGLAGDAIYSVASHALPVWSKGDIEGSCWVNLHPADGVARQLLVAPADAGEPTGPEISNDLWKWSEVRSGVATLSAPVLEVFVPQMLNYESVGGVSFKKGCYPGQEVVARSQFRGTLKRRAFVAHADAAMVAGADVYASGDETQPVGTVVQAAVHPQSGFDAIVSLQLSALNDQQTLHLSSPQGTPVQLLPLPYTLLDDI